MNTASMARKRPPLADEDALILYRWLTVPRIVATAVSALAIVAFWATHAIAFDTGTLLFVVIPVFLLASGALALLAKRKRHAALYLYAQLGLDTLVVAVGTSLTGGIHSPFVPLFFSVIVSAGIVSLGATLAVGAAAAGFYWLEVMADAHAMLPAVAGMTRPFGKDDAIAATLFLLIIGVVAFQSYFYATRIRAKDVELLKFKDEFLFRTIHDLRSPATVIRLVLDKYGDAAFVAKNPGFKEDAAQMQLSLGRMTTLIEDLLKIGRGETVGFALKKDRIDLPALVGGVVKELGPVMAARRVKTEIAPAKALPMALGDADKLKEVFANFVDNAIKYNKEGGRIFIAFRSAKGRVTVEVRDTGIGISEKSLMGLFAPYFRGDIGREIQGTGLGLYMTKRLVEKMGGGVHCSSKKDEGSTFTVTLPSA